MTLRRTGLRRLAAWAGPPPVGGEPAAADGERCALCPLSLSTSHRHLLALDERRILCVCETCWALHSGDPGYRPAGNRRVWLQDAELRDDVWASLGIPIGLAFFLRSGASGTVVALYPSAIGVTENEVDPFAWRALEAANPLLERMEPDAEALVVNRLTDPPQLAIAPIDECYRLVGVIKTRWEGMSGGDAIDAAVGDFFAELRAEAVVAS